MKRGIHVRENGKSPVEVPDSKVKKGLFFRFKKFFLLREKHFKILFKRKKNRGILFEPVYFARQNILCLRRLCSVQHAFHLEQCLKTRQGFLELCSCLVRGKTQF